MCTVECCKKRFKLAFFWERAGKIGEDKADSFNLSVGRGKFLSELASTPVRGAANVGSPDHCSTRAPGNVAPSPSQGVTSADLPDMSDPALNNDNTYCSASRTDYKRSIEG